MISHTINHVKSKSLSLKYQRFYKDKGFNKFRVCGKNLVPLGRNKQIENTCPSEYPQVFNNGTQCCKSKKYSGAV